MFNYKSTSYEKVEKPEPEKKFKKNGYEEIKKLIEDASPEARVLRVNEGNNIVKEVKNKKENNKQISYNCKLLE